MEAIKSLLHALETKTVSQRIFDWDISLKKQVKKTYFVSPKCQLLLHNLSKKGCKTFFKF
jgi:hypothetical protein